LMQVARRAKCLFQREAHISSRATGRPHDHHVARPTRKATLVVSARSVELVRSSNLSSVASVEGQGVGFGQVC